MVKSYFHRVHQETPTRFWVNNPTVSEARQAIVAGAEYCTTNPTYAGKMLVHPEMANMGREILEEAVEKESDDSLAASLVQAKMVQKIMNVFEDIHHHSGCKKGWVSLQGDPEKEEDHIEILREAEMAMKMGPNYIAKVPVTKAGITAIQTLVAEDVPVIATEVMSLSQAVTICEAYIDAVGGKKNPVPLYVTHITGIFDQHLGEWKKKTNPNIADDVLWYAGILAGRKQYSVLKERKYPVIMLGGGARGLHHFTQFVGADMHITINWKGTADKLIEQDPTVENNFAKPIPEAIVEELLEKVPAFKAAWEEDGLSTDDYSCFGPVELFRSMFLDGWKKLVEEVKRFRSESKIQ